MRGLSLTSAHDFDLARQGHGATVYCGVASGSLRWTARTSIAMHQSGPVAEHWWALSACAQTLTLTLHSNFKQSESLASYPREQPDEVLILHHTVLAGQKATILIRSGSIIMTC